MIKLSTEFDQENENQFYWTDGENVFHRGTEIAGADLDTKKQNQKISLCVWRKANTSLHPYCS